MDDPTPTPVPQRLGEELPIFCERCGYTLHGLPQTRCPHCDILQFRCPECGHHQPINSLRPAFQRMLGRLRAWFLGAGIVGRLAWFALTLLAWFSFGYEISYEYHWRLRGGGPSTYEATHFEVAEILFISVFAAAWAGVTRMTLLRWRSDVFVSVLAAPLPSASAFFGALWRWQNTTLTPPPWSTDLMPVLQAVGVAAAIGGIVMWPLWSLAVRLFFPKHLADLLLAWQRFEPIATPAPANAPPAP